MVLQELSLPTVIITIVGLSVDGFENLIKQVPA